MKRGVATTSVGVIFHVPIVFYTVVYAAILFLTARYALSDVAYLAVAIAILMIFSALVERSIARHFFFAIVPVVLSISSLALLFFIDSSWQRYIIIGVVTLLVYTVTLGVYRISKWSHDAVARGMVIAGATTAIFFSYAATFAIYLNFIVPQWLVGVVIFGITAIISWQYFVMIARGRFVQTILYSAALSIVLMEVAMSAVLWPFGYLTTSVILLMIYYILWDLGQSLFLERLSKTRLIVNVIFFLGIGLMVLISAQWLPVV